MAPRPRYSPLEKYLDLHPQSVLGICTALLMLVGWLDYISGIEIRIFPLYFIPIGYLAWYFGINWITLTLSILASGIWVTAGYLAGRTYSHVSIWLINFISQGSAFVFVAVLVGSLRNTLRHEQSLSRTDTLTGLTNSRGFYEQATLVLGLCHRQGQPVTLTYLDLDNFKRVNDTFGHTKGDQVLQIVGSILIQHLRKTDIKARIGGDEFVLLVPNAPQPTITVLLENIRLAIAEALSFSPDLVVTASIGAVYYDQAPMEIDSMIREADHLMYAVKGQGKNRVSLRKISPD